MKQPPKSAVDALLNFGYTLENQPKWRAIWSEDKLSIADGKLQPEYAHFPAPCWVLEKWCENTMGKDLWESTKDPETHEYIIGPYTSGSYELSYAFPAGTELEHSIVALIPALIRAGVEKYTVHQRKIANRERLLKAEEDWRKRNSDIWDDSQGAFNNQAFSGAHGHRIRGPEDIPIILTDKDISIGNRRGFGQL